MFYFLSLTGIHLLAFLSAAAWLKINPPQNIQIFIVFSLAYVALAPFLYILGARRINPSLSLNQGTVIYLFSFIILALTAAYSFEFYSQFVKLRFPLVVMNPPLLTLIFIGVYLPAALVSCQMMSRFGLKRTRRPILLGKPAQAIPIPPPAQLKQEPAPVFKQKELNLSPFIPEGRFSSTNRLTLDQTGIITETEEELPLPRKALMEKPGTHSLQKPLEQFSAATQLTLSAFKTWEEPLFPVAGANPICEALQETESGREHCRSYCGRSVEICSQEKEVHFFKCGVNLHVFSIPMAPEGHSPLVIQGGRRFLSEREAHEVAEKASGLTLTPQIASALQSHAKVHDKTAFSQSAKFLETTLPDLFSGPRGDKDLQDRLSRNLTLFSLLSEMRKTPEGLIRTLITSLGLLFNVDTAAMFVSKGRNEPLKPAATFGRKADLLGQMSIDLSRGLFRDLMERKEPISARNTLDIMRSGFPGEILSVVLFPVFAKNTQNMGVLAVINTELVDEDLRVIDSFCQQAALIQENHGLQEERQDLTQDVSVLLEIAKTVGSVLDSEDLLSIILEKSTQFLEAEQGSLMLLDEERDELTVKAMKGFNRKIVELLRIRRGEGISGRVLATGEPLVVNDIESDDRVRQYKRPRYKTKSFICVPLKLNSRVIGILNLTDKATGKSFSDEDLHILISIGTYAAVAIERSKYYHKTEELKKISITDSLTGLLNRRYFQERISEEIERSRRHQLPLSLIMIDVDDFKEINDAHGHLIGDEVLKIASRSIRNSIRAIDVPARYGGEEFTVILPQTNKADAFTIAERICSEMRRLDFPFIESEKKMEMSVSIGLATFPEDTESLENLIRNADIALYNAKSQGKDRVITYEG